MKGEGAKGTGFVSLCTIFVKTIIGSGILALPFVVLKLGYVLAPLLILVSGAVTVYSLVILTVCAGRTVDKEKASFMAVMNAVFPGYGFIPEIFLALKCLGVAVGFLVLIGKESANLSTHFIGTSKTASGGWVLGLLGEKYFWVVAGVCTIGPVTFFRKIDSLKYTSFAGLGCVGYLLCVLLCDLLLEGKTAQEVPVFSASPADLLKCLPLVIFAYGCQQSIFPLYAEAQDSSPVGMAQATGVSVFVSSAVYSAVGVVGCMRYGPATSDNILENLPIEKTQFMLARVFYVLLILLSFPLQVFPLRQSLARLLPPFTESERVQRIVLTTGILVGTCLVALVVPSLAMAQKIVGAVATPVLGFIIPAAMYLKLATPKGGSPPYGPVLLLLFGAAVVVLSLSSLALKH
ncbi:MAG: vacuolar amino acid transporter [Amphiamblys sp. WSBS2006]|nr:MAG: vacuolar amino acid transporter [Amphiamblys sp. WSBS2006]